MYGNAWPRTARVIWKGDPPGKRARAPVAATIEQTADAAHRVSQRNTRRQDVGALPKGQTLPSAVQDKGQRGAEQAAVIDQAAMLDHEDFPNRFAGKLLVPIGGDVQSSRTHDRAQDQPRT